MSPLFPAATIVISIITIGGSLPFLLSYLGMTPSATTDIGEIEGVAHSTSQGAEGKDTHSSSAKVSLKHYSSSSFRILIMGFAFIFVVCYVLGQ